MPSKGIKILLPDGDPNGIQIIQVSGLSGRAFIIPRGRLKRLGKDRSEKPGVYFLTGEEEEREVYIGESENFGDRLKTQDAKKEFWDKAIVFTGRDLDKADVRYLESLAVTQAERAGKYKIKNKGGADAERRQLSDFDKTAVRPYFETLQFILSVLKINIFEEIPDSSDVQEMYYLETRDASGRGALLDSEEFIVYAGAKARVKETEAFKGTFSSRLRAQFLGEGILELPEEGSNHYILTEDYVFTSPSAAAATLTGFPVSGWEAWKDEEGNTLDENVRQKE